MPQKFKFMLLVAVSIAYGSLPHVSINDVLMRLGLAMIAVPLMVAGVCLYHRKPVWERRAGAGRQTFLELVPVWDLRVRTLRRLAFISLGCGIGILIANLVERAPA